MLILTRKSGESLYINDSIKITVLGIQGKQVKLGIELPDDSVVYREEVYLRIKNENEQVMGASPQDIMTAAEIWQKQKK